MGLSDAEEPIFVLEDGTVLVYSLFGAFKTSFSMGQEAKDMKILNARYATYLIQFRKLLLLPNGNKVVIGVKLKV